MLGEPASRREWWYRKNRGGCPGEERKEKKKKEKASRLTPVIILGSKQDCSPVVENFPACPLVPHYRDYKIRLFLAKRNDHRTIGLNIRVQKSGIVRLSIGLNTVRAAKAKQGFGDPQTVLGSCQVQPTIQVMFANPIYLRKCTLSIQLPMPKQRFQPTGQFCQSLALVRLQRLEAFSY